MDKEKKKKMEQKNELTNSGQLTNLIYYYIEYE